MVGIGEASYSTIAPTIISDMFVKNMRSKMLALFYFAIPVGSGLGYIVGAEVSAAFGSWQWGLRATPVMGIVAVVCILVFMIDPPRGESEGHQDMQAQTYQVSDTGDMGTETMATHHQCTHQPISRVHQSFHAFQTNKVLKNDE